MKTFDFRVTCNDEFELEHAVRTALQHMEKKPDYYDHMGVDDALKYHVNRNVECQMQRVA